MYSWIWLHLPGNKWIKSMSMTVLLLGFAALLWFVIFPWLEPMLPFNDVTVG